MTFICYPKCTTCQRARAFLDGRGAVYAFRDIRLSNPTFEELKAWHQLSGLPLRRFFNTSGLSYKALGLKERLPAMSEDELLRLLSTDGLLVKRPILLGDGFVLVGFNQAEWEAWLP
jgi:arsenate reductase